MVDTARGEEKGKPIDLAAKHSGVMSTKHNHTAEQAARREQAKKSFVCVELPQANDFRL